MAGKVFTASLVRSLVGRSRSNQRWLRPLRRSSRNPQLSSADGHTHARLFSAGRPQKTSGPLRRTSGPPVPVTSNRGPEIDYSFQTEVNCATTNESRSRAADRLPGHGRRTSAPRAPRSRSRQRRRSPACRLSGAPTGRSRGRRTRQSHLRSSMQLLPRLGRSWRRGWSESPALRTRPQ